MFGAPPPPLCASLQHKSPPAALHFDDDSVSQYAAKLQAFTRALLEAAGQHHKAYLKHTPSPPEPPRLQAVVPGDIVLVLRPRRSKLIAPNSGPYLVISVQKHTATLKNLATNQSFTEHLSNVRRFAAIGNTI
jgi:hypothetical protein